MTIDAPELEQPEPLYPEVDGADDNIDDFVAPRRRRVLPSATWALLFALVGGGGFLAGVKAQHSSGSTTTSGAALANAFRNGGGRAAGGNGTGTGAGAGTGAAGGQGGATAGPGGATIGQIKLVDGNNVYVSDAQGNVVKVHVGSTATVSMTQSAAVADLKAGANVLVRCAAGADGTVEATSVSDLGAGGAGTGGGAAGLGAATPNG
jgi:hypothetical protein